MSTNSTDRLFGLDDNLIRALSGTETEMNAAIRYLYRTNFKLLSQFILQNNGTIEEAEDIFQDVILSFINIIRNNKFRGDSSIQTFLYTINKHYWLNELKRKKNAEKREKNYYREEISSIDTSKPDADPVHAKDLIKLLDRLGPNCRQILTMFYYENLSMKEILSNLDYENEQVVRNKKYKCLKQLQEMVLGNSNLVNYLNMMKNG